MDKQNYIKNIIDEVLNDLIKKNERISKSSQGVSAIKDFVLERIMPKYEDVIADTMYGRTQSIDFQLKVDVAKELTYAIEHFKDNFSG